MRKIVVIVLFLCVGIFLLPTVASYGWPKKYIENLLEQQLGGTVSIHQLRLSWTREQLCRDVEWINPKSNVVFTASAVRISSSLYNCFKYKDSSLRVLIEDAKMSCPAHLRFLKKKKRKNLQLLFSPVRAIINQGEVQFDRTEIALTESLKVVSWGTVDLGKNTMNITLGLPPRSLEKMFRAKGLPEDYLLEIPISTKLSSKALEKQLITFFLKTQLSPYPWQRASAH